MYELFIVEKKKKRNKKRKIYIAVSDISEQKQDYSIHFFETFHNLYTSVQRDPYYVETIRQMKIQIHISPSLILSMDI